MSAASHGTTPYYFVPGPSRHPVMAAIGLFFVILGAGQWINGAGWGAYSLAFGLAFWLVVLFQWFSECGARERKRHVRPQDRSVLPLEHELVHLLGSDVLRRLLHRAVVGPRALGAGAWAASRTRCSGPTSRPCGPAFRPVPPASPGGIVEPFQTMGPFWLPTINTALLLTSGVTLTIAHHALQAGNRGKTIAFMWMTVLLGIVFLFVQGYEYYHAYTDLNLKLSSGVYGSTFFMLTGFHGFHVFVGMLMLLFITLRLQKGHFTPRAHFGFEGAAWYWHFVDVVWLGLYILVYWL